MFSSGWALTASPTHPQCKYIFMLGNISKTGMLFSIVETNKFAFRATEVPNC